MTITDQLAEWATAVEFEHLPRRIVELAKSQVLSQLAAARSGRAHPHGEAIVRAFGAPLQRDPRRTARTLAGLTAWLHEDDTAYAGHVSHSAVNVALAYGRALRLDGASLLVAVVIATECAARVAAAATIGPFRGQSAACTHLAGGVAARLRCERAPVRRWRDAFGLAFGMPPWTLMRGFLGSDSKVLSALAPVQMALDACDAAAAGLRGADDILEHPDGFLARFADVPLPHTIGAGLGTKWHTDTLSFKVHPGGPGVDAAVDCALELHRELGERGPSGISRVRVQASIYTAAVEHSIAPYLRAGNSPVSALVFSAPYTVATALLTGQLSASDFAAPAVHEDRRWELAAKVNVEHDLAMTRRFILSTVPVGEALREGGSRAAEWMRVAGGEAVDGLVDQIGAPSPSFEDADKATPARVIVELADGHSIMRERDIPLGAAGDGARARHGELMRAKFLATGGASAVADVARELERAEPADVVEMLDSALR